MKKVILYMLGLLVVAACSKEDEGVVTPTSPEDLPLQIVLDEDENGNFEGEDKAEIAFKFTDRYDPTGESPGGVVKTLSSPATVSCIIKDFEGFSSLTDYISGVEALYEVDDCTEMEITVNFDANSGEFSFIFPAGVEEVKMEIGLDEDFFDDDILSGDRGFTVEVLGLSNTSENVVINTDTEYEFKVLDDELIFGEYEMDVDQTNLDAVKALFSGLDEDIDGLTLADIDAFEMEVALEELAFKIVLVEEEADDCDPTEMDNVEIEIEGEFEELTDDDTSGEIEFVVAIEEDNGAETEYTFSGSFTITGDDLELTLESEDLETGAVTLNLAR